MRVHARMHYINQQVNVVTHSCVEDNELALSAKSTFGQGCGLNDTDDKPRSLGMLKRVLSRSEDKAARASRVMSEALERERDAHDKWMNVSPILMTCLTDIDDVLCKDFDCNNTKYTIGQVAQAANCPWDAFLDSYMEGRNIALKCFTSGRRRELILAAAKGADGLEQLYQTLMFKIAANDQLIMDLALLCISSLTCAGQFLWSNQVEPEVFPTEAPTWQTQIQHLFNRNFTGGHTQSGG